MHGRMWADLLTTEIAAKSAQHHVTGRALVYVECGLPLDTVLDALKISRATWYRRVQAWEAWRLDNRAAGQRVSDQMARGRVEDQAVEVVADAIDG